MNKAQLHKEAKRYKKAFETMIQVSLPYVKNERVFWLVNYTRFSKNTGFSIIPEEEASYQDIVDAFWNMGMSTSLVNGVSKEMVEHLNKSLDYLENLEELLEKWRIDHYSDAKLLLDEINQYKEMVAYYQKTQNEIRGQHKKILSKTDDMTSNQMVTEEDTEELLKICSLYNYLIYTQSIKQLNTIKAIQKIHNNLLSKSDSDLKELKKYTDYYINPKSLGLLNESLKDFAAYGEDLAELPREEGEAKMHRIYVFRQKETFGKEFMPLLRNKQHTKLTIY